MNAEESENFFDQHGDRLLETISYSSTRNVTVEQLYQAFKSRLLSECVIQKKMTPEEYEAWVNEMVKK